MIDGQVLTFTLVAAALTLSPGADTMLVVRNVLRGGRHDGVVTAFGICSGLFLHAIFLQASTTQKRSGPLLDNAPCSGLSSGQHVTGSSVILERRSTAE